jgi:16S rRNA (guanine527-N7)-methyltransferase
VTPTAELLEDGLRRLGLLEDVPPTARLSLLDHLDRVREANRSLNLTRITDPVAMVRDHVLDSLAVLEALRRIGRAPPTGSAILDVGSGAGFPGVPIAIVRPDTRVVLAESRGKKAAFLENVVRDLGRPDIRVAAARAADLRRNAAPTSFALVTARAVGTLSSVLHEAHDLVAEGGLLVHYKGPGLESDEIVAVDRDAAAFGFGPAEIVATAQAERNTRFVVQVRHA